MKFTGGIFSDKILRFTCRCILSTHGGSTSPWRHSCSVLDYQNSRQSYRSRGALLPLLEKLGGGVDKNNKRPFVFYPLLACKMLATSLHVIDLVRS